MVVHRPGEWLSESLRGLASQDYPGLQSLVLVTGQESSPESRGILDAVANELPTAVVRFLGGNPGYAAACNSVLSLVQGTSGFFCFLHDDVALAPDAITRMVEELYRSNAGVVGPKIVQWDNPRMIQSVGIAADRFGVELPYADDGELDQEQHDAVQDVFVLPSTCVMVRADLFRTVGGFNPSMSTPVVDLDFCWRCHASAARVIVAPAAVVRHRMSMDDRLTEDELAEVNSDADVDRVRTALALSTAGQVPALLVQLTLVTVLRAVVLLFTGRARRAVSEVGALLAIPGGIPSIRQRRSALSAHRRVEGAEVRALQLRGSAHVTAWARSRARRAGLAQSAPTDEVREVVPRRSMVTWLVLLGLFILGSRSLILHGVVGVGQMAPFSGSGRELVSSYASGWWGAGFGQISALPTGIVLSAVAMAGTIGHSGLAHTLSVVSLPLIGWLGAWRFASVMGTRGARLAGLVAYAAVPLPYAAIASGRWGALLVYAALPWMVHLLRRLVGLADLGSARDKEVVVIVPTATWRRWFAGLVLVCATVFAFEPAIVILFPFIAVVFFLTSLTQGLRLWFAVRWLTVSAAAMFAGLVLNLPWVGTYVRSGWWEAIVGAPVESGRNVGLLALARFDIGDFALANLSIMLFAAAVGALFVVRGVRAAWALRGVTLVVVAFLVAMLDDSVLIPVHLPEPALLLTPVAFGLSVCAATMGASLSLDLGRGRFSWRQPLGALVAVAFSLGTIPFGINSIEGRWRQPSLALPQLLTQLPDASTNGDYRTLFIGDPRVLPGSPLNFGWGISYSVINGPMPTVDEQWEIPPTRARDNAVAALYGIVRGQTARAGRLLAPLAVRFIVVPIIDGGQSTRSHVIPAPPGLIDALSRQLDLRRLYASPDLVVFENASWVPVRSVLTAAGSESSKMAGATSMIATDIGGATALPHAVRPESTVTARVPAGTLHLAVPFTSRWELKSDGTPVPVRPAFGVTNAYDLARESTVSLEFKSTMLHKLLVALQAALWAGFIFVASSRRRLRARAGAGSLDQMDLSPAITMGEGVPR